MSLARLNYSGPITWEPVEKSNYDALKVRSDDNSIEFGDKSRTRQEFSDECDINNIMKKYKTTGMLTHMNKGQPSYYDFTDTPADLQAAMNMMLEADQAFMRLPAQTRLSLGNDPVEFVKFAADADNIDQMREWGLAPPKPVETPPLPVVITNPAPLSPEA